ncbi:MAG: xylose isomerase [Gemmataceae bacterium]|nr:MAG: xylose isomerase [Gemmataceae bacterium]
MRGSRRDFLAVVGGMLTAGTGALARSSNSLVVPAPASAGIGQTNAGRIPEAIDPVPRPGNKPLLKLSLAAYSYRQYLDLKKPSLTLFDFIDIAAWGPLEAVELTSYYFAETSDAYLKKLKDRCRQHGLAISGVPVGNNFCRRDPERLKSEIDTVKAWLERAAKLEAETVRIFAGSLERGDTLEDAQRRVVAAIEECCAHAEKVGVKVALENHGGITATPELLLTLVKQVRSKAFGVNVDTGNFHTADPYADIAKIVPYGIVAQVKTEIIRADKKREEADLPRIIRILKEANFQGYVALEYEAAEEPKVAVPRYLKQLRQLVG